MSIAAQLRAIADQLDATPANGFVGPGVVEIDGAVLKLDAPLRSDWKAPMATREMTRYGRFGGDPSNAPEGKPKRSPAGYPLHYPIGGSGPPRVGYGDTTHDDDAAVEAYKASVAVWEAQQAQYR